MTMDAAISLRKSYGSDLVSLKIVSLPGVVISSKSSLLALEQKVLVVIDWGGRTKFDILFTTGAKASFWSFEMASIVLLMISSSSLPDVSVDSMLLFGSEMKSTSIR